MDFRKDAKRISLNGEWQMAVDIDPCTYPFHSWDEIEELKLPVYAVHVPSNFELELYRQRNIEDPFVGMNIASLTALEKARVYLYKEFDLESCQGIDNILVIDGIEGSVQAFLNENRMDDSCEFLEWLPSLVVKKIKIGSFDDKCKLFLRLNPNGCEDVHEFLSDETIYSPFNNAQPQCVEGLWQRRAPHSFGWDIMPRALSAGITRDVYVLQVPHERLINVWLDTLAISEDHTEARLSLFFESNLRNCHEDLYEVEVTGSCGASSFCDRARVFHKAGHIRFTLDSPKLWQPRDRGEQNLYDCRVNLIKNGEEIDHVTFTHGIRTVELDRTSTTDMTGSGEFCFKVNGEKLFVRGTNWVPLDAYHSRDIERVEQALELADEIGCNMIRCWGGNVYESDLFYEICDRKGILVWQDFAMACAVYPQDERFCKTMQDEVREVVQRLRQHPCIALWAGDNECDLAYSWGGRRQNPNRNKLTRQVIPDVLFEEDPSRPYLPSSPYIDEEAFRVGEKYITENHLWGPRDYYKSDFYTQSLCHFASEIGYHGCPSPESIRKFISSEKLWPYWDNDEWILHCTSPIPGVNICDYRVELMAKQIRELFGKVPDNLDDFAFASQCSQAEAKKFFIEMFRLAKWRRTGIIWWNLLDGWPQFSDAVVDYYFEKKLAFDFIKRAQSPLLVAIREPNNWNQEVVVCSEMRDDYLVNFRITDIDTEEVLLEGQKMAKGDRVTPVGTIPYTQSAQRFYAIEWSSEQGEGRSHYLAGNPPFDLEQYRGWLAKATFNAMSGRSDQSDKTTR